MCCRPVRSLLFLMATVLVAGLLLPISARGQTQSQARIALHLQPHVVKNGCLASTSGGAAPTTVPCSQFMTEGDIGVGYDAYLVVAQGFASAGIAGVVCGIDYDGSSQSGVSIFGWQNCGDLEFPSPTWPGAGSGNIVTWNSNGNCQTTTVGGEGVQAIAGFFYVFAYSEDRFEITPRYTVSEPDLAVADCSASESPVPLSRAGAVSFSQGGAIPGCNPCNGNCGTFSCDTSPELLDFGAVGVEDSADLTFTISNTGTEPLTLPVRSNCPDFLVLNGGLITIDAGNSRTFTARFQPASPGPANCAISLGDGICGVVTLTGVGTTECDFDPPSVDFGQVALGESGLRTVLVTNTGDASFTRTVQLSCPEFELNSASTISLDPGQFTNVTVIFRPTTLGAKTCVVSLGSNCGAIAFSGEGISRCSSTPSQLSFGTISPGLSSTRSFRIENNTSEPISGVVQEDCPEFSILAGGGVYVMDPGSFLDVLVEFSPTLPGYQSCEIEYSAACPPVLCSGSGSSPGSGSQAGARLALHVSPTVAKNALRCVPAESGGAMPTDIPCSAFNSAGNVLESYNVYIVAAGTDPTFGISGVALGIDYSGGIGSGLEIFDWISCGDLEFPGNNWPQPGGGNVVTWASSANCQRDLVPGFEGEGAQAVLGSFYVYAYQADILRITPRNYIPEPDLAVADCGAQVSNLPEDQAGWVLFNAGDSASGCNPCLEPCLDGDPGCTVAPGLLSFPATGLGSSSQLAFVVTNTGGGILSGSITLSCSDYSIPPADASYVLAQGQSHIVPVTFAPTATGPRPCQISTGGGCETVTLQGIGVAVCDIEPPSLNFGTVELGSFADRSFTIRNVSSNPISGSVNENCADFTIPSGGGAYTLAAGESLGVTVRYAPQNAGTDNCLVTTGSVCAGVACVGNAVTNTDCDVSPTLLNFGTVLVNNSADRILTLTNLRDTPLSGNITLDSCPGYEIVTGGGLFSLQPAEELQVRVRFSPASIGAVTCVLRTGSVCGDIPCSGTGTLNTNPGSQPDAKLALHLGAAQTKSPCLPATAGGSAPDNIPCTQYSTGGTLGQSYSMYLVVGQADPAPGIAGVSLGISYGSNLSVFDWNHCADLEFPGNNWPASAGGNVITWAPSNHCQNETVPGFPGEGVHAIAGWFYVYAYGPDSFQITPRTYVPNPDRAVADCNASESAVDDARSGSVSFSGAGNIFGCNPCLAPCGSEFQACSVSRTLITYPDTPVGSFRDETFTLTNTGTVGFSGTLSEDCAPFEIVSGGGSYTLAPGGSREVTVRYQPTDGGAVTCVVETGTACANVTLNAGAVPPPGGDCSLSATTLEFSASVGDFQEKSLTLTNTGSTRLTGEFTYTCDDFVIVSGGGPYSLMAGQSVTVLIRYQPQTLGSHTCVVETGNVACGSVNCLGSTGAPLPVELLSFAATRAISGVEISWEVAGRSDDFLGFHLHRDVTGTPRVRVTEAILGGADSYRVVDPDAPGGPISYWLAEHRRTGQIKWHGPLEVDATLGALLPLAQNRPNPFRSQTRIGFRTEVEGPVLLRVFDLAGREVARLVDRVTPAGYYEVNWDAADSRGLRVRAGIYLYRLETRERTVSRKLVVLQ